MEKSIAVVGLGRMGKNIALQLIAKGYDVVGHNRSQAPLDEIVSKGARPTKSFSDVKQSLKAPRVVWLMLPSGDVTENAIKEFSNILDKGDIIIDGSNSMYKDSARRYELLKSKGIRFLDSGSSGGPGGALTGMSLMIGGDKEDFNYLEDLFRDLSVKNGYSYIGPAGSGHFVKMVHNAIEYGMMQSIAEGLDLVANGPYKSVDLADLCRVWNNGSVVRGFLIETVEKVLKKDSKLSTVAPYVEDTGEGRWAIQAALEYDVPFTGITHSLYERFSTRYEYKFGNRLLAALRNGFGWHAIKNKE